jgi:hypothetical protein
LIKNKSYILKQHPGIDKWQVFILCRGFDGNEDKGREVICAGKNCGR